MAKVEILLNTLQKAAAHRLMPHSDLSGFCFTCYPTLNAEPVQELIERFLELERKVNESA